MTVVFLTSASSSPWDRPGDFTDAGHTVEMVGCGGNGGAGGRGANTPASRGGSGGGYLGLSNPSGTLGATTPFAVKASNATNLDFDTNATFWEGTTTTNTYEAECGSAGTATVGNSLISGGAGVTNGSPSPVTYGTTTPFTGGNGAATATGNFAGSTGGGGAAGPTGAGKIAGVSPTGTLPGGGTGGGGSNGGSSSSSGASTNTAGTAGGEGTSGAGHGNGSTSTSSPNGSAGTIGGGGGGGAGASGTGAGQVASGYAGGDLGNVSDWIQTSNSAHAGVGGGGGGGGGISGNVTATSVGGNGANYGGGAGAGGPCRGTGSTNGGGTGGEGLIVITYTPGAATHQGEGRFAGTGNLSADNNLRQVGYGNFAGVGSLRSNVNLKALIDAQFAGAGAFSVNAVKPSIAHVGEARFAGTGSFRVDTIRAISLSVNFAGVGSFRADTSRITQLNATFAGTGNFSAGTSQTGQINARFAGAGAISIDAFKTGAVTYSAEARFVGAGAIFSHVITTKTRYLRPDADDAVGGWLNESDSTPLYPSVDEAEPAIDSDYIKSSVNPVADICRFRLPAPALALAMPAAVRLRFKRDSADAINLTMRLKQGGTTIATWVDSDIPADFVTIAHSLLQAEFDAITDSNDLFIELQADPSGGGVATLVYINSATPSFDSGSVIRVTAADFGTASAARRIIVVVTSIEQPLTSIVIGGVNATIHVQDTALSPTASGVAIASAIVPTGTSGDIVVTYSAGIGTYTPRVHWYSVDEADLGYQAVVIASDHVAASTSLSGSIAVLPGGFVIYGYANSNSFQTPTPTKELTYTNRFNQSANSAYHLVEDTSGIAAGDASSTFSWSSASTDHTFVAVAFSYGSWTPADLPNLLAWYKADAGVYSDAGTTPAVNDDPVQQWNDQSGHGYHLKQATSGNRPVFKSAGFNGSYKTLQFTAASARYMITDTSSVAIGTGNLSSGAFVGQMSGSTNNWGRAFSYAAPTGNDEDGGGLIWAGRSNNINSLSAFRFTECGIQAISLNTPLRWLTIADGVNTTTYLNDGSGSGTANNQSFGNNGCLQVGTAITNQATNGAYWDGMISEVIITTSPLNSAERANLQAYFKAKWGLVFSPLDIPALQLWLDASDAATRTIATGVSAWADKSGKGNNATQATGANQPTVSSAAQNGLDALDFDGLNHSMSLPDFLSGFSAGSVVCVFKDDLDPNPSAAKSGAPIYTSSAGNDSAWPYSDEIIYDNFCSTAQKTIGNVTPSLASWSIVSIRSTGSDYEFYVNGTSVFSTGTNTYGGSTAPTIGLQPGMKFQGLLGEIAMTNNAFNTSERQRLEGFMAWKWGIQSVLPGGHPYASSPP